MTLKVRILPFLTTFTQLTATLKNFLRGWLLVLNLKEGLVECATVCVKNEVILSNTNRFGLSSWFLNSKREQNTIILVSKTEGQRKKYYFYPYGQLLHGDKISAKSGTENSRLLISADFFLDQIFIVLP